jgi:N6-adenosine-specific RNA methylase IME4
MEFPNTKYKTIYADPPWLEIGGGKIKRGADKHYPLMKTKDIIALPVNKLAEDNAHLYLWVTNNFLEDGLDVMRSWGFVYKTMITWAKDKFGLGQYFRGATEQCLFGVKGTLPYKIINGKRQQGKTILYASRLEHSAKPLEMYDIIEKVSYPDYIELFARNTRDGWSSWGNEI